MMLSELIAELEALKHKHGDIRIVCAPYSYREEARRERDRWWASLSWLSRRMRRNDPQPMLREPDPCAWGLPGFGSVRENNPAIEITL